MAAAAAASSPSASASSKDDDPPSPPRSPSPYAAAAAPAAADDDMNPNPNPPSSPDPSPSSANSDPSPNPAAADAAPPSAVVALGCFPPSRAAASASTRRRLPPPCWTHEETEALIQSYRQKWYALRRGNLRASHWEEVADAVSRRCRHLYAPTGVNTPKTPVQCRHKMEKLRKRYRSEKRRPHRTSWVHFREMDTMEMGAPVSAAGGPAAAAPRPKAGAVPAAFSDDNGEDESDDEDNEDDDDDEENVANDAEKSGGVNNPNIRSIHAVMSKSNGGPGIGNLRFQIPKAVRSKVSTPRGEDKANTPHHTFNSKPFQSGGSNGYVKDFLAGSGKKPPSSTVAEEMRKRVEERQKKEREGTMLGEMVAAVRMLGDGFIRVEEMKMEMAREMEKLRMEMELKRTEMILESQRRIVDAFVRGAGHENKKKKPKVNGGDGQGDR